MGNAYWRYFNPRSPWGERRIAGTVSGHGFQISIHAPRGGSDIKVLTKFLASTSISIHAPRGGSDTARSAGGNARRHFNPRSPWGERPFSDVGCLPESLLFQSTLPVGGATSNCQTCNQHCHISIHAPRGGSDACCKGYAGRWSISIHAPRGGSDYALIWNDFFRDQFQSTLPVWGATFCKIYLCLFRQFQSTLPVGGATTLVVRDTQLFIFQSTLPVGGATHYGMDVSTAYQISIHAPRGGSDRKSRTMRPGSPAYFNPRSPWGERPVRFPSLPHNCGFQSTLPVGGATNIIVKRLIFLRFQSTLPVGGAT